MRESTSLWRRGVTVALLCSMMAPAALRAQRPDSVPSPAVPTASGHYWRTFALGFATSILLHEAGHIATSYAVGGHPSFGFDKLRPTVYSGISGRTSPHGQFLFSVSGLAVQTLLDEAILDIPHRRGSTFERGLLAGGIGTTLFYLTIGRTGSVSDVDFVARTHGMSKAQMTLLFGGMAALHTVRIARNRDYAHFFARPRAEGGLDLGVNLGAR